MNVLWILIAFAIMAWFEIPGLLQNNEKRDMYIFYGFYTAALLISILHVLGVNLPNPINSIEAGVVSFKNLF